MKLSHKLGLIGSLYIAEGLPGGFFHSALPALLRQSGFSLTQISLVSLLALPWMLKFLWAPLVDKHYSPRLGRRRSWILPIQFASAAVLLITAFLGSQEAMPIVLALVLITNLLAATLDVAVDGLAVALLKPEERGFGNGIQVAGYRFGAILSGGLLLAAFEHLGWQLSFFILAALILLATIPVWLYQEPDYQAEHSQGYQASFQYLSLNGILPWLAIIFVYKLGDGLGAGMVKPYLIDRGLTLTEYGLYNGTLGAVTALAGAILGGIAASRFGALRMTLLFGLLQVAGIAAYAISTGWPKELLFAVILIEGLVSGMVTAAVFTMMMQRCRQGHEGNDYTWQACAFVLGAGIAHLLSGPIAQYMGYSSYFIISAAAAMIALLPLYFGRAKVLVIENKA